jgi:hypothetical protein
METMIAKHQGRFKSALPTVNEYEGKLESLNDWWGKITLIGKINSHRVASTILGDMQLTRDKFGELQQKLIDSLLLEHLKKCVLDDSSRAQVAVDILIRNLFERTADVGFLATDDDIRSFLINADRTCDDKSDIEVRLREYVKKYSVYDEILIIDTQGEVVAHLDQDNPVQFSADSLIHETLHSDDEYLETFRHSDLQAHRQRSLIYSCKITASNSPTSENLGVLCLCFRFNDETAGIFKRLLPENSSSQLMLLDSDGVVIASSDCTVASLGEHQKPISKPSLVSYKGRDYLVNTAQTQGYQGFLGLGWSGHMMSPIDTLFKVSDSAPHVYQDNRDIASSKLYSRALKEIHKDSLDVNEDLRLVVLNGKITAARSEASEFIPVLEAIKQIGEDTANVFDESIKRLQETVISSRMNDVQFLASLAVDIMDRNLYERANDCRWWALTSKFQTILAKPTITADDGQLMSEILAYINSLYTVYSNLYLYDKQGDILAVSNAQEGYLVGQRVGSESGAADALQSTDSQAYFVSPFVASPYYGDRQTYIYNAAITHPEADEVVGGIGIVFDSIPQFESMLLDALPRDEQGSLVSGCFGLFTDRSGNVIGSAGDSGLAPGGKLEAELLELEKGQHRARILTFKGALYIVGVAVSQGYREYKTTGDYENDILGFVFVPF